MANSIAATPFDQRSSSHPLSAYLLRLMVVKSSNLCLSADVDTASELLSLADSVGPSIVVLKTHYDIVRGWNYNRRTGTGVQLAALARKHGFLIFEDRKFGDIGSTVQKQYVSGEAAIIEWAHITNLNMIPGAAVVTALSQAAKLWRERKRYEVKTDITAGKRPERSRKHSDTFNESDEDEVAPGSPKSLSGSISHAGRKASIVSITTISQNFESANAQQISEGTAFPLMGEAPLERGLLILAQMSSAGNLMTQSYTSACLAAARDHKDVVMGFISQESLNTSPDDNFITMTPGCQLPPTNEDADYEDNEDDGDDEDEEVVMKGDGMGQQYNTPKKLVQLGCDVVIVGRGIIKAEDPVTEAERYRKKAWKAYLTRVGALKVEK